MFYLARLEETVISVWVRETGWVFFTGLTLHSLSLALVIGVSLVILWRELGFAAGIPASQLWAFIPLAKIGLVVVLISGSMLLLAYPAKALTNPVFYLKLLSILLALTITRLLVNYNKVSGSQPGIATPKRRLAGLGLLLWFNSVTAGRFLAYTHSILLASSFY